MSDYKLVYFACLGFRNLNTLFSIFQQLGRACLGVGLDFFDLYDLAYI